MSRRLYVHIILSFTVALLFTSCRIAKYVPEEEQLLRENELIYVGGLGDLD